MPNEDTRPAPSSATLLQAYADIYRRTAELTGRKSVLHEASAHASAELLAEARTDVDRITAEVESLRVSNERMTAVLAMINRSRASRAADS